MKRETVVFAEFEEETCPASWENFELVKQIDKYHDLEKSWKKVECVVKRISDGKFFKFEYILSPFWDGENALKQIGIEAFPVTKMIEVTTYE